MVTVNRIIVGIDFLAMFILGCSLSVITPGRVVALIVTVGIAMFFFWADYMRWRRWRDRE